jgi:hypothetical protein
MNSSFTKLPIVLRVLQLTSSVFHKDFYIFHFVNYFALGDKDNGTTQIGSKFHSFIKKFLQCFSRKDVQSYYNYNYQNNRDWKRFEAKNSRKTGKWESKGHTRNQQSGCQQVFSRPALEKRFSAPYYQHYHGRRNNRFYKPASSELFYHTRKKEK